MAALRPHAADDMLFFVYTDEAAAAARTRLFVRRRQAKALALPADLAAAGTGAGAGSAAAGAAASKVDWRASVLLMVVLQTGYRLSVVTAADPELLSAALEEASPASHGGGGGGSGPGGVWRVTKTVHASPRSVLDGAWLEGDGTQPAWVRWMGTRKTEMRVNQGASPHL